MAKGGRYLDKNKKSGGKKKGRGWKIFFIVLAVLLVLLGSVAFVGWRYINGLLSNVKRAETVYQDISDEDLEYWATYNPDKFTESEATEPITEGAELPQDGQEIPPEDGAEQPNAEDGLPEETPPAESGTDSPEPAA